MSAGKPSESRSGARARLRAPWRAPKQPVSKDRAGLRGLRNRLPPPIKRLIRRVTRISLHSLNGVLITVVLLFVLAWLWLPTLAQKKPEIEALLADTIGKPVRIEQLDTFWDGLNPGVRVQGLRLGAAADTPLGLRELRLSLAWWPLLTGRVAINQLVVVEPNLVVEHLPDGRFRLTGIDVNSGSESGTSDVGEWLLRQHEMVIENGTFEWIDRQPAGVAEERFTIRRVHIQLRNDGRRHRFEMQASFPKTLCGECRVRADVRGNPLGDPDWSGELALQARELTLAAMPRLLRARLPAGLDGRLNLRLESNWRNGWPQTVSGRLAARELRLPLADLPRPLKVRSLESSFKWRGDRESGRLDLARLSLGLTGAPWLAGRVHVDYAPDRRTLEIDHVNIGDLAVFAAALEREDAFLKWLRAAKPDGNVDRLRITLDGPQTAPQDYTVNADLRGLRFAAHERLPGMSALSGRLQATRQHGEFRLESAANRIQLPRVLADPIETQRAQGRISWRQEPEHWLVRAEHIDIQARDGRVRGAFDFRLPADATQSPVLKLDLAVTDGVGAHAARYIPLITPEKLRQYLERAIVSGRLTQGNVRFHGALRNFPFRDGKGIFEVRAHVTDGVLSYLPGWEPLRNIEADMKFTGIGMRIAATTGSLRSLQARRVVVSIDDFKAPDGALVVVNARLNGPVADTLDVLADSNTPRFAAYLIPGLKATGNGILTLDLHIPARNPAAFAMSGDYQLLGGGLEIPFRAIRATELRGRLGFTQAGLQTGQVQGRLLGGDTSLEATPLAPEGDGTRLDLQGVVTQAGLDQLFGAALSTSLRGEAPWKAQLLLRHERPEWQLESDLRPLEIRLPAPLAKARGEPLQLGVRTLSGAHVGQQLLDLQMAGRVTGRIALRSVDGAWEFDRGRIGIGERVTQLPEEGGLMLSARLPALNADRWWKLVRQNIKDKGVSGWFDYVNRMTVDVDALEVFDRPFGQMALDIGKRNNQWRGQLQGEATAGQIVFLPSGCSKTADCPLPLTGEAPTVDSRPAVYLTLDRLAWPAVRPGTPSAASDPRSMPVLSLKTGAFSALGYTFDSLELSAEPVHQGWQISRLLLVAPESRLMANGAWEVDWQEQQSSHFTVSVTSTNFGTALERLGYPEELVGGRLTVESQWSWPGAPADAALGAVAGEVDMTLTDGRLPKISPGAGRLLGVLDLRSLTRYLSLDLSSLFGKGMTFDRMQGKLEVAQGNAHTRGFTVHSPGADMDISGRIGLVRRDLDLEMGVVPHLVEELTIGGTLLGGPAGGAAVAVLHNLFRKPFEKGTRILYTVKGSWEKPDVKRQGGVELPPDGEQP